MKCEIQSPHSLHLHGNGLENGQLNQGTERRENNNNYNSFQHTRVSQAMMVHYQTFSVLWVPPQLGFLSLPLCALPVKKPKEIESDVLGLWTHSLLPLLKWGWIQPFLPRCSGYLPPAQTIAAHMTKWKHRWPPQVTAPKFRMQTWHPHPFPSTISNRTTSPFCSFSQENHHHSWFSLWVLPHCMISYALPHFLTSSACLQAALPLLLKLFQSIELLC